MGLYVCVCLCASAPVSSFFSGSAESQRTEGKEKD